MIINYTVKDVINYFFKVTSWSIIVNTKEIAREVVIIIMCPEPQ